MDILDTAVLHNLVILEAANVQLVGVCDQLGGNEDGTWEPDQYHYQVT